MFWGSQPFSHSGCYFFKLFPFHKVYLLYIKFICTQVLKKLIKLFHCFGVLLCCLWAGGTSVTGSEGKKSAPGRKLFKNTDFILESNIQSTLQLWSSLCFSPQQQWDPTALLNSCWKAAGPSPSLLFMSCPLAGTAGVWWSLRPWLHWGTRWVCRLIDSRHPSPWHLLTSPITKASFVQRRRRFVLWPAWNEAVMWFVGRST